MGYRHAPHIKKIFSYLRLGRLLRRLGGGLVGGEDGDRRLDVERLDAHPQVGRLALVLEAVAPVHGVVPENQNILLKNLQQNKKM